MQTIGNSDLAGVYGGEGLSDVLAALKALPTVPIGQVAKQTMDFIADHPFFHRGLMNAPISLHKHFRNVPFIGPGRMVKGIWNRSVDQIARGWQVTRGTWHAK